MINVGDEVICIQTQKMPPNRIDLPKLGKTYTVTGIYSMPYGLGCNLQGMSATPYRGYFLKVEKKWPPTNHAAVGWYFALVEQNDPLAVFNRMLEQQDGSAVPPMTPTREPVFGDRRLFQ